LVYDLYFELPNIKCVDDTIVAPVSRDPDNPALQDAADHLVNWCNINGMLINTNKKYLFHFGRTISEREVPLRHIHDVGIERVQSFKLLNWCVILAVNLSWSAHVAFLLKKVSKRVHILCQLVRAGVSANDIIAVYCSVNRSILEYACPVWHPGLTKAQSEDLERVQKRCLKII
jgi:hypothetical protein